MTSINLLSRFGIGLIVLSLTVPWLFLREPFDLLLDSNQLLHLTSQAQSILASRQALLVKVFQILPWISLGSFLTGLSLSIFGLLKWRKRQFVRDQSEDFGLEKLRRELNPMSPEQVNAKLEADVQEGAEGERSKPQLIASTKRIREFEVEFYKKLGKCFGLNYDLLSNQRLGSAEYDFILAPRTRDKPDLIVEIKYIKEGFRFSWMRESFNRLLVSSELYQKQVKRNATSLLLIVTSDSATISKESFTALYQRLPQPLSGGRIKFVAERELESMSCDEFSELMFG